MSPPPKLTNDPVLELHVALSRMVRPVDVFDDDYQRVTNALREVLSGLPAPRRRRLIVELGMSLLQQLLERERTGL